jgi:hypothetical protein
MSAIVATAVGSDSGAAPAQKRARVTSASSRPARAQGSVPHPGDHFIDLFDHLTRNQVTETKAAPC